MRERPEGGAPPLRSSAAAGSSIVLRLFFGCPRRNVRGGGRLWSDDGEAGGPPRDPGEVSGDRCGTCREAVGPGRAGSVERARGRRRAAPAAGHDAGPMDRTLEQDVRAGVTWLVHLG